MKLSSQQIASQILKKVSKKNATHTSKGLNHLSALLHKMPKSKRSSLLNQFADPLEVQKEVQKNERTLKDNRSTQSNQDQLNAVPKQRRIPFHHLSFLTPHDFQKVFKGLDRITWLKALKIAEPEFKDFVLSSISVRIRGDVEEELAYLGPVRLGDAQDAQQQIIEYAQSLEEKGQIAHLEEEDLPWLDEM